MTDSDAKAEQQKQLLDRIEKMHKDYRELIADCISLGQADADHFIKKGIPQSELFMVELIPFIHRFYMSAPVNVKKTVLDVGPQSFGGTRLLQSVHNVDSFNKLKLEVTALDIVPHFMMLQKLLVPEVEFLLKDLFQIKDRAWDFLICSHVVEHVPEPVAFLKQAQTLANDFVLVACPWNEDPITTKGHVNTIREDFVEQVGGENLTVYNNYMWGKQREVCIFSLPGTAKS